MNRKAVNLEQVRFVVLDEADEMLNMGFKEELDTILSFTEEKQTWLFPATMPKEIRRMVKDYMNDPFEVRIDPKTTVNTNIEHHAVVHPKDKAEALTPFSTSTSSTAWSSAGPRWTPRSPPRTSQQRWPGRRHPRRSQPAARDRVMMRFKQRDLQVLIATDVAARGIDVNDLTHVFHFALPNDQAYYTHCPGRTARAGKKGISMSLIGFKEKYKIHNLEGLGVEFARVEVPLADAVWRPACAAGPWV